LLEGYPGLILVPILVVTEVVYLLETRLGAESEVRFLGDLAAGELVPEPVEAGDWMRIAALVAAYRDLPLGSVDASIVAGCRAPQCRQDRHSRSQAFVGDTASPHGRL